MINRGIFIYLRHLGEETAEFKLALIRQALDIIQDMHCLIVVPGMMSDQRSGRNEMEFSMRAHHCGVFRQMVVLLTRLSVNPLTEETTITPPRLGGIQRFTANLGKGVDEPLFPGVVCFNRL